jgi:hypothetical protein
MTDDEMVEQIANEAEDLERIQQRIHTLLFADKKSRGGRGDKEAVAYLAEIVWKHLLMRGHAYYTPGGQGYLLLEDRIPIEVTRDGREFAGLLERDYKLMPAMREKHFVGEHVGLQCWMKGERIVPRTLSHYEPTTDTVYMAEKRGFLIRITKDRIQRVPNGTDGQMFLYPDGYEEWTMSPSLLTEGMLLPEWGGVSVGLQNILGDDPLYLPPSIDELIFGGVAFEDSALTTPDKKVLITLFVVSLLMRGIVREKPVLAALGPTGSGKTFLLRALGKLLQGDSFEVSSASEDQKEIENQLVNNAFVVFDDLKRLDQSIRAMLRRAVTGGQMQRRELYSTSKQITMPYIATVAFSSSEQPFHDGEDVNRQISFTVAERPEGSNIDERALISKLLKMRPWFLSHMACRVQTVLRALHAEKDSVVHVPMRLAGTATLLVKLMRFCNPVAGEEEARSLLDSWKLDQEQSGLADNDLAEALSLWIKADDFPAGKELTAGEILQKLQRYISGKPNWATTSWHLSTKLRQSSGAYGKVFGMETHPDPHLKYRVFSFNPPSEEEQPEMFL